MSASAGPNIRARRESLGMTQAQLARAAGLSRASVCQIEAGAQYPGLRRLEDIARALCTTAADLVRELPAGDGAVTTPRGAPATRLAVRLSPAARARLEELHATGLRGCTLEDTATELLLSALRAASP